MRFEDELKRCQRLKDELRGMEAVQADNEEQLKHLTINAGRASTPEFSEMCEERQRVLLAVNTDLESRRKAVKEELREAESNLQSFEEWQEALKNMRAALKNGKPELRQRLNMHLKQLIDKIEVFAVGFGESVDHDPAKSEQKNVATRRIRLRRPTTAKSKNPDSDDVAGDKADGSQYSIHEVPLSEEKEDLADYICEIVAEVAPDELQAEWFNDFLHWVTERRMSKDGRFLRIHFKTGTRRDIVPKGSIASGRKLEADENGKVGWRVIQPDIDSLRQEFLRKRKKRR